ncbi:MAG: hypothetical protein AAF989_02980, partial [Planctomycetota bacterium]
LASGGRATLASYGGTLSRMPESHLRFFQDLRSHYETAEHIFVHAGYTPGEPMSKVTDADAYWNHLSFPPPLPHQSGKTVFVGHTPQSHGNVLDLGHVICLDTYCFGGGYLTAMDVNSRDVIQVDRHGHQRRHQQFVGLEKLKSMLKRLLGRPSGESATKSSAGGVGHKEQVNPLTQDA